LIDITDKTCEICEITEVKMISILPKGAASSHIILVAILIVVLVVGLSALQVSCSKKPPQGSEPTNVPTQTKTRRRLPKRLENT